MRPVFPIFQPGRSFIGSICIIAAIIKFLPLLAGIDLTLGLWSWIKGSHRRSWWSRFWQDAFPANPTPIQTVVSVPTPRPVPLTIEERVTNSGLWLPR